MGQHTTRLPELANSDTEDEEEFLDSQADGKVQDVYPVVLSFIGLLQLMQPVCQHPVLNGNVTGNILIGSFSKDLKATDYSAETVQTMYDQFNRQQHGVQWIVEIKRSGWFS
jgi:hypothetical protein